MTLQAAALDSNERLKQLLLRVARDDRRKLDSLFEQLSPSLSEESVHRRWTTSLSNPRHKRDQVVDERVVDALIEELRLDGGNTLANLLRGWRGVDYEEIVNDVANALKVTVVGDEVETELNIVAKVVQDFYDSGSADEKAAMDAVVEAERSKAAAAGAKWAAKSAGAKIAVAVVVRQAGATVVKQIVTRLMALQAGRFAVWRAGQGAATLVAAAIPFVNIAMGAWMVIDIASPAMRKTVPSVIQIALLRMEYS
jgi:uncharacterized protein YaaW (UPF0174 family)